MMKGGVGMDIPDTLCGRALATVDTAAIGRNFRLLRAHCHGRTVAVVKANAYGHGVRLVVPALLANGCDFFAVATLPEALEVRRLAPRADILILGYTPPQEAGLLLRHRLTQTVFSPDYAAALSLAATGYGSLRVHLKIDGGMCRLGFSSTARGDLAAVLSFANLRPCGLYTHFPSVGCDPVATRAALRDFRALGATLPHLFAHAAASAAALTLPDAVLDGIRPGLALYGYAPVKSTLPLTPALALSAPLVQIRAVPRGTPVGYDGIYRPLRDTRIGVLPIGYADGLSRRLSGLPVTLCHGGARYPVRLVGHICMDQAMVDLGDAPACVGDRVLLFDDVRHAAAWAHTIPYELLSTLSARVDRRAEDAAISQKKPIICENGGQYERFFGTRDP